MITQTAQAHPSRFFSFAAAAATALLLALPMSGLAGCWPLLFVALVPLLSALRRLPLRRAACMGMFCGLLYNLSLLYWIVIVLGRYGGLSAWISVPVMTLLAWYMAVYLSLFCLLLCFILKRSGGAGGATVGLITAAPIIWVGLDYLRSFLFTGFPWMDLGYGLFRQPLLVQAADLGGHHLVTYCIILVNCLLVLFVDRVCRLVQTETRSFFRSVAAACVFLLCVGGYSFWRYQTFSSVEETGAQAVVSVIQGNINQDEKWSAARKEETVAGYLALSRRAMKNKHVDLVVWPETALPFYPQQDPLMEKVLDFIGDKDVRLLTGAPYFVLKTQKNSGLKPIDYFNSALLINPSARLAGRYDKQHLVPFGEYVPLRAYLPFIEPLVVSVGDFTAGSSCEPLQAGKIKAGVLICFESIFPEIARREAEAGANLLVNLTNDAWYGRSSAPYQSFAMSIFRAVETRRWLVRAANTGISGFIEPTGKIRVQSQLFEPAFLTETLDLLEVETVFTRGGHWFGLFCLSMILPLLLFFRKTEFKVSRPAS
jgi:apolipoprotein N-acyltransferase